MPKTTEDSIEQGGQGDAKAAPQPEPTKPGKAPKSGQANPPGQEASGFQDPLPPGTDSKSGPGSSGPV
jgi:hypothetical protein